MRASPLLAVASTCPTRPVSEVLIRIAWEEEPNDTVGVFGSTEKIQQYVKIFYKFMKFHSINDSFMPKSYLPGDCCGYKSIS